MKISSQNKKPAFDFDAMIKNLIAEHGNIFFAEIDGEIYIYKALGRRSYKTILSNPNIDALDREDAICKEVILWPEEFDPDDCEAGVPSELYSQILTNSFLTGIDDMVILIETCRGEVEELDVQMSCIISEAFPNYEIEEIESWDMIKFCSMFSKAEWKLKNLRNMELTTDVVQFLKGLEPGNEEYEEESEESSEPTPQVKPQPKQQNNRDVKVGNREMTADEYKQYLEMQKMFPDIDWGADTMYTGFGTETVSTVPVALR